ncbi:MAG: hypothetical protein WDW38_007634 [Sanguina aurantia]
MAGNACRHLGPTLRLIGGHLVANQSAARAEQHQPPWQQSAILDESLTNFAPFVRHRNRQCRRAHRKASNQRSLRSHILVATTIKRLAWSLPTPANTPAATTAAAAAKAMTLAAATAAATSGTAAAAAAAAAATANAMPASPATANTPPTNNPNNIASLQHTTQTHPAVLDLPILA